MKFKVFAIRLAGLWLSLIRMHVSNAIDPNCNITLNEEKQKAAYCDLNKAGLTIPSDLEEDIQILTIIQRGKTVVGKGPLKFANLTEINLTFMNLNVSNDFFSLLHNLKSMSLFLILFEDDKVPELPPSITMLEIAATKLSSKKSLDLSKLNKLEILSYVACGLTEFPSVPNKAPLTDLNISGQPLTNVKVHEITQYCLLKNINLSGTSIQFGSTKVYCELKRWFESHNITYDFDSGKTSVCPEEMEENEDALDKYDECLARINPSNIKKIIIAVVILLLLSSLIAGVYYFIRRRRNTNDPEEESDDHSDDSGPVQTEDDTVEETQEET